MKIIRIPALLLAAAIQLLPMCRTVTTSPAFSSTLAIIFRWTVGASAAFSAFDSVSGSTQVYFDSPGTAVGTVGVPFTYFITLGGSVGDNAGSIVAAAPLPTSLTNYTQQHLTSPLADWGVISGTPTSTVTNLVINLAASNPAYQSGVPMTGTLRLTVYPTSTPVVITTNPTNRIATNGQAVSFSAAATGSGPLTYQWFKGDTNIWNHIQSATNATYTFTASTNRAATSFAVNSGTYMVRVAGAAGMVCSDAATLIVNSPLLSITESPTNLTAFACDTANFYVTASGTTPVSYQWYLNGTDPIPGATGSTYSVPNVQFTDAGFLTAVVANSSGALTSAVARLTVIANPAIIAPSISTSPTNLTIVAGQSTTLVVEAGGTAPLNYQWQYYGDNIPGATSAQLDLTPVTVGQAGDYTAVVFNCSGSVTSSVATLTVLELPAIAIPPQSQSVVVGGNATFDVTATGTDPLSYQWQLNDVDLPGANSSTLILTGVTANQAGNYAAVVANSAGSVTSIVATLTVLVPPAIATPPASQTVTAGGSASFNVTATGTAPFSYQWQFKGANIPGATSATLALTGVTTNQAGNYAVVVINSAGFVTSSTATLTVLVPPAITTPPASQTVTAGGSATFNVTATGTAPLSYQWQFNGADLSGANSATLALTGVTTNEAGNYAAVVANSAGSVTSIVATLTVRVPPAITAQPANLSVTAGASATFSVTATGTEPLSYQWAKDAINLPGATNSSLSLATARTSDAGNYSVVVTNAADRITSANALLTITLPAAPTLTALAFNGSNFRFSFTPVIGLTNSVLTNGTLDGMGWSVLTNIPPPATADSIIVTDDISGSVKFYRISLAP